MAFADHQRALRVAMAATNVEPITEDWLKSVGFKWHQLDRQPDKHWLLWLGGAIKESLTSYEDLGIELAPVFRTPRWFCWLRGDSAGRYHRFIHLRYVETRGEIVNLVTALSGQAWDPDNHHYGGVRTPEETARIRAEYDRLDRVMLRDGHKWSEIEKDDSRGRALPEHLEAHEKGRKP
jgi:hypothetical protein